MLFSKSAAKVLQIFQMYKIFGKKKSLLLRMSKKMCNFAAQNVTAAIDSIKLLSNENF